MERPVDDKLDGTGGGYGKYRGVTIKDLQRQFDRCRSEGGMRGVSAVLRIAREQLDARGGLGSYPGLLAFCLTLLVAIYLAPLGDGPMAEWKGKGMAAVGVLCALFGYATLSTWKDRKLALYQEQRIRQLSLEALRDIVSQPGFSPKELDYTQKLTLERLLKKTRVKDPELISLLKA